MDPVEPCLPEIILDDSEVPDGTQSGLRSASQEELDFHQLSEVSLQTSLENSSRAEQLCPTEPRPVMDGSASQTANSDQRTDGPQRDSIHIQDSPLSIQALSPGAGSQLGVTPLLPDFTPTPCFPPDSCCLSPIASTPNSSCGFSPIVLVRGPVGFWCSPHLVVLLPEVRPSWCLWPIVAVHQPCSPYPVSRRAQQVSEQFNITPELRREQAQEVRQKTYRPDKDKLRANNTDDKRRKSKVSPGSLPSLDEEQLAERAFEEYMTIMDSLSPKIQEGKEAKENENEEEDEEEGNSLFLEYLEELCSDEDFVKNVERTLNIEYLVSLLSADPEPIDLLALEKQEQEVLMQERQPSVDVVTEETSPVCCQVGSTLKTEHLDSNISSDQEPTDIPPRTKQQHEPLRVLQQHLPPSAESNSVTHVTKETSPATSSPQRAQSPILDPPGTQSDTNPNPDGQNAPLSMRNSGSKEGSSSCYTLVSSVPPDPLPTDVTSNDNPVNAYSFTSLTSDSEAKDSDAQVGDVSEGTSVSLSNLADKHSAQTLQKLPERPQPEDPPASESPSTPSVSGPTKDPHTIAVNDPMSSFRADLLTVSPPAQTKEPEEQCYPKNINPNSSCLEDNAVPVQTNLSFGADSYADSCVPPVNANLSDFMPEKQTVKSPKGLLASQEFASSGVSSGEGGKTERTREKNLGKGVGTTVNKIQIRHSHRLLAETDQEKARLIGEFFIEREEEKKPSEKSVKKTEKFSREKDRVSRTFRGRQLFKKESCFEAACEQFSKSGEIEQNLAGEMQKPKVDRREQCKTKNPNGSTETRAENAILTTTQEEKKLDEGKVKGEGIPTSSFMRRRTRSTTEEETPLTPLPTTRARGKIKPSEMERSDNKQENATESQILLVKSQVSDKVSEDCGLVSQPKSSPQSPRAQTETHSTRASIKDNQSGQESPEGLLNVSPYPHSTPAVRPETQQQRKTVAISGGGVTGTETWDFYSLRSWTSKPNVPKGTGIRENRAAEATHHPSQPKPSPDKTGDVKREGSEPPSPSPIKRYQHKRRASEERETRANEAETISSSPTKRGRRKEVNSGHKLTGRDEAENKVGTSGCETSPPLTRSKQQVKVLDLSAGQERGKSKAIETRAGCMGTHVTRFPCKRQTPCSRKLPAKYTNFILGKKHKQQAGTVRRGARKRNN